MATRMLIDGRHPEETRVAVVKGNRIEEFDFEAAARQQIKGNIYLAKVTRVEPSLQAAFVDYGGNRHGFLAFSEIHPDYYQIPKEDRDALLREEQLLAEETARQDQERDDGDASGDGPEAGDDDGNMPNEPVAVGAGDDGDDGDDNGDAQGGNGDNGNGETANGASGPEEHGNPEEASAEALRRRRMALRRRYKIQDVIRRRQVMLVQVVKEERGNKGAALTTYISLAGRYSVLMPNTAHGGGISRKIANAADRKRLKAIMADINLPKTMGAIVRTAGLERTRAEIRRDFDYLTRLWDEIRERTLGSTAPALIYEDSDLIKRAIRDIYSRDIDEVLIDGGEAFEQARSFMRLLMPSHARKVKLYDDPVPLFHRAGVETQLAALMSPLVTLRSGGYIVINPTEALVAIDVNSGRSTREYNIEETALKTNIEAAEEVARQLRLRDLAGLVVVDFIDMEVNANNRKVERALKDALKSDRARIQVGRISAFGLLEMSRQRLRTGVLEASTEICSMCEGLGLVRTPGSAALAALRLLEEDAVRGRASLFQLRTDKAVAIYILNRKRAELSEIEERYGIVVEVAPDEKLSGGHIEIDASGPPPAEPPKRAALAAPAREIAHDDFDEVDDDEAADDESADDSARHDEDAAVSEGREARRRRRRGGRGRGRGTATENGRDLTAGQADDDSAGVALPEDPEVLDHDGESAENGDNAENGEDGVRRRRRRRRRGGRGRDGAETAGDTETTGMEDEAGAETDTDAADADADGVAELPAAGADIAADTEQVAAAVNAGDAGDVAAAVEVVAEPVAPAPATPVPATVVEVVPETVASVVAEVAEVVPEPAPETVTPAEPAADAAPAAAVDAGEAAAKPAPKPRGRPRKKVVAEPVADAAPEVGTEAADAGEAAPKPAPKPRGRPRKKVVAEPAADAAPAAAAEAADAGEAAPKPAPKPRGRPRKKVVAEPVADAAPEVGTEAAAPVTPSVPAPAESVAAVANRADTPAPAAAVENTPAPAPDKGGDAPAVPADTPEGGDAGSTPGADENAGDDATEAGASPRRGWWQRTFGE